jgi:hypothetical protein
MALRKIITLQAGPDHVTVYRDSEWDEYRVRFYYDGKLHEPADYHDDDKQSAMDTAASWALDRRVFHNCALVAGSRACFVPRSVVVSPPVLGTYAGTACSLVTRHEPAKLGRPGWEVQFVQDRPGRLRFIFEDELIPIVDIPTAPT